MSARRSVLLAAVAASALGLAVRVAVVARGRDLPPDGCVDLTMARELLAGRTDDALRRKFHPLAAVLEAGVARGLHRQPDETCGILVSLAAGALVPLGVALAAASLLVLTPCTTRGNRQAARTPSRFSWRLGALAVPFSTFVAGALAALHPYLIEASATVESYPLAHACLALSVAAALAAVATGRARAAFAAGLAAGLGYLARPDGLVLVVGLGAGLAVAGARRGRLASPLVGRALALALVGVGFAIPATPYILALHRLSGRWLTLKKDVRHLAGEQDPRGPGVAAVTSDLSATIARAQHDDATVEHDAPKPDAGLAWAFLYTLRKTSEAAHPLVLVLALVGVVAAWPARRALVVPGAVLAAFLGAHTLLKAHEGYLARHHATGEASLFLALAGVGLGRLGQVLARTRRVGETRATLGLLLLSGLVLAAPAFLGHAASKSSGERAAAAWIREHAPPDRELVVAGESAWPVAFLAEARYLGLPAGDARTVAAEAARQGASFLVLYVRSRGPSGESTGQVRSAVEAAGLEPPAIFEEERPDAGSGVIVYTWLIYTINGRAQ